MDRYVNFIVESDRPFFQQGWSSLRALLKSQNNKIVAWNQEQVEETHLHMVRVQDPLTVTEFESVLSGLPLPVVISCYDNDPLGLHDGVYALLQEYEDEVPPAALKKLLNTWLPFDYHDTSGWEDDNCGELVFSGDYADSLRGALWQLVLLSELLGLDIVGTRSELLQLTCLDYAKQRSAPIGWSS